MSKLYILETDNGIIEVSADSKEEAVKDVKEKVNQVYEQLCLKV